MHKEERSHSEPVWKDGGSHSERVNPDNPLGGEEKA